MGKNDIELIEEQKVEGFFERLTDKSVSKTLSWFLIGIFLFLSMIICMMPAQELLSESEDDPVLMLVMLIMLISMAAFFRVSMYKQYNENQKIRELIDIFKYHPVNKKAIWKLKMRVLIRFLGKITCVGLLLQLIVTFVAYKTVSWINFVYIFGCVFFFPVAVELLSDVFKRKK